MVNNHCLFAQELELVIVFNDVVAMGMNKRYAIVLYSII
jgi:hypothetical protein